MLSCRIMLCRSPVELVLDMPNMQATAKKNCLFQRPFNFGLSYFYYVYMF